MKFYFLLEERSMKHVLSIVLPKLFPDLQEERDYFLRHHNGKDDLEQAIPRFIAGVGKNAGIKVVIVRDQDTEDCKIVKERLTGLCKNASIPPLIRIACRELESWYLGDREAIAKAYPEFEKNKHKAKFRNNPDSITKPSKLLNDAIRSFQKGVACKKIPPYMELEKNSSHSFNQLITGLRKFIAYP